MNDFVESLFNPIFIAVNSLTLLVMSLSLLLYGHHMKNNLTESTALLSRDTSVSTLKDRDSSGAITPVVAMGPPTTLSKKKNVTDENINLKIKFKILARINKILSVVLVCYSLRVLCLGYLFVVFLTGSNDESFGISLWLVFSWLIPSLPVSF